jgi:hypothetical protein
MKMPISMLIITLMMGLILPPVALAQDFAPRPPTWQRRTTPQDWTYLQRLSTDTKLIVETKNDDVFKGKFTEVTDDLLRLTIDGRRVDLKRGDIRKVYLAQPRTRFASAMMGAAGLGAIGLVVGTVVELAGNKQGIKVGVATGAGVGAILGTISGSSHKGELIYEAK